MELNTPHFEDAAPTIYFITMVDRAFDLLNVRTPVAKGFKSAIRRNNIGEIGDLCRQLENFFQSLQDSNGDRIVMTRKSTGFIGMIFCLKSLLSLSTELLKESSINYILSYKFSQDHIELFFNAVRRACGWNNNPTSMQFLHIYKRLLMRAGLEPSASGNCVDFSHEVADSPIAVDIDNHQLSGYVVNVLAYISGYVVRKVLPRLACSSCRLALITSVSELEPSDRHLLQLKNNGGLVIPSKDVIRIVKLTENVFRCTNISQGGFRIFSKVLHEMLHLDIFKGTHFVETDHFYSLVQSIVLCFIDIRGHHVAHSHNLKIFSNRYRLTKQILFTSM